MVEEEVASEIVGGEGSWGEVRLGGDVKIESGTGDVSKVD